MLLSSSRSFFTFGNGAASLCQRHQVKSSARVGAASRGGRGAAIIRCSRSKTGSAWRSSSDKEEARKILERSKKELGPYPGRGKVVRNKALVLELAKGFRGKKVHRIARDRVAKALEHSYRDRRRKKRDFHKLWITRIGAAARLHGLGYSEFMHGLNRQKVELNRKLLANMAILDPDSFKSLADSVSALPPLKSPMI
ncbi:uncharacterized protein LOC9632889 [Selaginella moellendorffii]|nr:uncharacterized protein LOC9632889 [Selaginella moellendorffii]|eukprot:XP_002991724.2 uncharacterized protein LOC9632889 [Selaginella moellendorffii]